jgi:hypothetical protein
MREAKCEHPSVPGPGRPIAQYRLRRMGGRLRRRYQVMAVDAEGRLEWEWEPISKRQVFKPLTAAGQYVTDVWPLVRAADHELERRA